jgi:hypothetical protein
MPRMYYLRMVKRLATAVPPSSLFELAAGKLSAFDDVPETVQERAQIASKKYAKQAIDYSIEDDEWSDVEDIVDDETNEFIQGLSPAPTTRIARS